MFPSGVNSEISNQDRPLIVTRKKANGENLEGTNYFGMCEINPYYPSERQSTPSHLTEEATFTINKRIYLITWTMADRWIVKTMPFDVTNVTLIHTWATDSLGNTADPDLEWDYYQKTMQTIVLKGRLSELDNERGINMPFWSLYQRAVTSHKPVLTQSNSSSTKYLPQVARAPIPLYYAGQADTINPSYLLYEAVDNPIAGSDYCYNWTIPKPDSNGIIMHKGKTYAMRFPNRTPAGSNGYNYWDGKYIVIEGPGQTIDNSTTNYNTLDNNQIRITGNSSFNNMRHAPDMRYDWNYKSQHFERYTYTSVDWSNAYITAGTSAWDNNQRFELLCLTGETGFETIPIAAGALLINQHGNNISLTSDTDQTIHIYSATGQLVTSLQLTAGQGNTITLPKGIYLIHSSQETTKIICQ